MSRSPLELVVCASWHQARHAGFDDRGRHRQDPHIIAWWPAASADRLYAARFGRVTITDEFGRHRYSRLHEDVVPMIRSRLDVDAIWMEL
jgi:hypothetical protein